MHIKRPVVQPLVQVQVFEYYSTTSPLRVPKMQSLLHHLAKVIRHFQYTVLYITGL